MTVIETNIFPKQDNLPPEILRPLQVEEFWARRNVLSELMNAERLQTFSQRCVERSAGCIRADIRTDEIRASSSIRYVNSLAAVPMKDALAHFRDCIGLRRETKLVQQ